MKVHFFILDTFQVACAMYRDQTAGTVTMKENVTANLELLVKNVMNAKIISMGFQIVKPQQQQPPPQPPQPPQLYLKHQV